MPSAPFSFMDSDFTDLPSALRSSRSLLNIRNNDSMSVLYCIAAALQRKSYRNRTRPSLYNVSSLRFKEVSFPTFVDDLPKLEAQNSVQIKAYQIDQAQNFKSLYTSDRLLFKTSINLLVLNHETCPHYVLIKDIAKFVKKSSVSAKYCLICKGYDDVKHNHPNQRKKVSKVPTELSKMTGLVYIKTEDSNLLWSIVIALLPKYRNCGRINTDTEHYQAEYEMFQFPDITNMEIIQGVRSIVDTCLININIFIYEDNEFLPRFVPSSSHERFVDLVMLEDQMTFLIVNNLSALFRSRSDSLHFVCRRCLEICMTKENFDKHSSFCLNHKPQRAILSKEKHLRFTNIRKQYPMLFVVYADFEAMFRGTEHVPISVAWKMISVVSENSEVFVYTGLDCVKVFVDSLLELYESIKHYFAMHKPLLLTEAEEEDFQAADSCYICGKEFEVPVVKVRDHDHQTGEFIIFMLCLDHFE